MSKYRVYWSNPVFNIPTNAVLCLEPRVTLFRIIVFVFGKIYAVWWWFMLNQPLPILPQTY